MNFKPMFLFANGERQGNAQVFATEAEALASATDRFMRWTMPQGIDTEETSEPVNYRRDLGRDVPL